MIRLFWLLVALVLTTAHTSANEMRLAVTTSFQNSGLADVLLPRFKARTGIDVQLLVVGTGQALALGRAGDVDAVLVHSKAAEEAFVAEGYAPHRREIMHNDFVLIGPNDDPAKIADAGTVADALRRLSARKSPFVSRGDDSGTHRMEQSMWKVAGLEPAGFEPSWYRAAGSGMGATLNTASGMNAYTMSDRASWLKFANKQDLKLLFAGDPALFNQYAYLPVSADRHPHVNQRAAQSLEDWLTAPPVQALIGTYTIGGETLFTPNATPRPR